MIDILVALAGGFGVVIGFLVVASALLTGFDFVDRKAGPRGVCIFISSLIAILLSVGFYFDPPV